MGTALGIWMSAACGGSHRFCCVGLLHFLVGYCWMIPITAFLKGLWLLDNTTMVAKVISIGEGLLLLREMSIMLARAEKALVWVLST